MDFILLLWCWWLKLLQASVLTVRCSQSSLYSRKTFVWKSPPRVWDALAEPACQPSSIFVEQGTGPESYTSVLNGKDFRPCHFQKPHIYLRALIFFLSLVSHTSVLLQILHLTSLSSESLITFQPWLLPVQLELWAASLRHSHTLSHPPSPSSACWRLRVRQPVCVPNLLLMLHRLLV